MRGGRGSNDSTDADTMEIGDGCFLMRPGRRQNYVEQPNEREESSTGNTAEAMKVAGDVEPIENGPDTDRVELSSRSGSRDGVNLLSNESSAEKKEQGATLLEKRSDESVEDTAGVADNALLRGLEEERTAVEGDSTPPKGVDHSGLTEDNDDEANLIHSDEEAPDPDESDEITNDGNANNSPARNPVLRALLQDMTRVGEASGMPSVGKARSRYYKMPGPSIVILLDTPLISPEDPWLSSTNDTYSWVSQHASDLVVRRNDVRKGAGEHVETPGGGDDTPPPALEEPCDVKHQDDGDVCSNDQHPVDVRGNDQHPAGLGDPKEALEALLSWVDEGGMSHPGGRNIILVCGSDSPDKPNVKSVVEQQGELNGDIGPGGGASEGSETGSAGSSVREGEIHTRTQTRVSGSSTPDKNRPEGARDDDDRFIEEEKTAPVNAHIDDEAGVNGHEHGGCSSSRPAIRQIILGKPLAPSVGQKVRPHAGADGVLHASDRCRDRGEAIAGKGSTDGRSLSTQVLFSETRSPSTQDSRQPAPARPSAVLLEVRPTQIEGEPRVAATFPPQTTPIIARAGHIGTVKSIPAGAHEGETRKGGEESEHYQQQLPRVIMGPVVGRVGPTSAVVLVEVDHTDGRSVALGKVLEATVSDTVGVQLTDALSGRRHEAAEGRWAGEPGSGPRVFEFENLTPGRRYAIRLTGVQKRDQVNICRTP